MLIRQAGIALIEVLVAWALLSLVIFSVVVFQVNSVREGEHAWLQSIAIVQVTSLLECLRVNKTTQSRLRELNLWNKENKQLLPHGLGRYSCQSNTDYCQVTLTWEEKLHQQLTLQSLL